MISVLITIFHILLHFLIWMPLKCLCPHPLLLCIWSSLIFDEILWRAGWRRLKGLGCWTWMGSGVGLMMMHPFIDVIIFIFVPSRIITYLYVINIRFLYLIRILWFCKKSQIRLWPLLEQFPSSLEFFSSCLGQLLFQVSYLLSLLLELFSTSRDYGFNHVLINGYLL